MKFKEFYTDYQKKKMDGEPDSFSGFLKKYANDEYTRIATDITDDDAQERFNTWNSSYSSFLDSTANYDTDTWHDSSYFTEYGLGATSLLDEGRKLYYYALDKGNKDAAEAFKATLDNLSNFKSGVKSASEYYAQWDSQKAFDDWKTWYDDRQNKLAFDTTAGQKEIDDLNKAKELAKSWEEERSRASSPETTTEMPSDTLEPAAPPAPPTAGVAASKSTGRKEVAATRREDYVPPVGGVDSRNQDPTNTELQNPYLSQYGYSTLSELEQAIANKRVYLREAQELQTISRLQEEAKADPEFAKWAAQGAAIENPTLEEGEGVFGIGAQDPNNRVTYEREKYERMKGLYEYEQREAQIAPHVFMTEEEVEVWNYLLAKDRANGTNKAEEYFAALSPTLEQRKAEGVKEARSSNFVEQALFSMSTGVETFFTNVKNNFSNEDYIRPTVNQMAQSMIRQEYENDGNWLATTTLDLASTTGNMLPAVLASYVTGGAASYLAGAAGASTATAATIGGIAGKGAMSVAMGTSSMGAGYAEMLNLGYSKDQARAYGAMVGITEGAMSYLLGSIGGKGSDGVLSGLTTKALDKVDNALARAAIQIGGSMGSEFIEEGLQTAIEPWLKSIATGVDFESAGIDEILYSGLLGALSAGVLEGPGIVAGGVQTRNVGKNVQNVDGGVQKLQKLGTTFSADTVAYKLANKIDENTGAYTIGRLFQEVGATISEQNVADITAAFEAEGVDHRSAVKLAKQYQAYVNEDVKLSQQGIDFLETNGLIAEAVRKGIIDDNTTVYQRSKGYADLFSLAQRVANGENDVAVEDAASVEGETTGEQGDLQVAQDIQKSILSDISSRPSLLYSSAEQNLATDDKTKRTAADIAASDKLGLKGEYSSNDTGATRLKDTRQKVQILDVLSVRNGDMRLKVKDGTSVKTVRAKDINFSTKGEALVYEAVANMGVDAATAWSIIKGFDPKSNQSGAVYALGVTEAYGYGNTGLEATDISDRGFAKMLTEVQRNTAHRLGKIAKDSKAKTEQKTLDAKVNAKVNANGNKPIAKQSGRVIFDGDIDRDTLAKDELRSGQIKVLEKLAEKLGITFHLYESKVEKLNGKNAYVYTDASGKKITASGMYSRATGEVWVDINAGNFGKGTILYTASHELTHFIKQWSPEKYHTFANFLIEQYGKKGVSVDELINQQIAKAKRNRIELSREAALEEVVADSCESFLMDSNIAEKISVLAEKDKSIVQKIKSFIGSLLKNLRAIVAEAGFAPNSAEGRFVQEMTDALEQLHSLWMDALKDASRTYGKLTAQQVNTLAEAGIGVDEVTGEVYALRDSFAINDKITIGKKSFDIEAVSSLVSEATGRSIEDARKWVQSEMTIANLVMKNPEFLDFEVDDRYEAIKKNSDYPQGTVDLSNLCPKRQEFTSMFDMLQKKYPNKLFTASDVAKMRAILAEEGITVACGACFVEDRRQLLGEIADTYINMWKEAVDTGKPLQKTNSEGKKIKLTVTAALAKQYGVTKGADILATDKYIPTQYDLTTYEGFKLLEKNHPTIAMGFNRYNNSRGQQSGRLIEGRAEYKRQILGWSENKVKTVNNNGGLRIFSFSDFEVVHLLDLVQVIIDCAAKGVKIQGYTKIPAFAKLVRNTGIKLNRSFIPNGETGIKVVNGKRVLDIDNTEGINTNDENFLDESDNPDVGNVIIGINPEQIGIAMMDDTIDYIIPFHSNKAKAILRELGLESWVNYKESQHEKDISTGKASKHNVNIYTQVINKYKPTNKVEFVESFLKECKRQGKIPRYSEFLNVDSNGDYAYREGYHKFLVDFKMFDKEGNILPQGLVTPDLESGFMTDLLNDEVDKKENYEFPQEVYDKIEEQFGENVQYSERGVAEDGKKIYESNFPKDTPKAAKSKRILDYIQNVWSKKPISLVISNGETSRTILAKFDPWFDESGNTPTDASKIAGGNRHGSSSEQRVTLDLADDYYQIASEATYNYSKLETGKNLESHNDVITWHYFVNDIYFAEYGEEKTTPYTVTINVKEKESGDFVYSFSAEKEPSTRRTLHAAVNTIKGANGELFIGDSIPQPSNSVKRDAAFSDEDPHSDRDIRYQDRDPDAITDRELLSNALVSATKNDIEKKRLKEYGSKIEMLTSEERKLGELNEQIRALYSSKGKRDMAKLRSLKDERVKTENRINTLDKMLLTLEASKPLREVLNREKDMVRKKAQEKSREKFSIYKSKQEEKMDATREYYREIIRENTRKARESKEAAVLKTKEKFYDRLNREKDRRDSTELRHKIKAFKQKLDQNLLQPTERQYVPAGLARAMIDVFDLIDTDTELYKADGTINKAQEKRNLTKEKLQALKEEYEKLKDYEDPVYSGEFDDAIYAMIKNLRDRYEGRSLKEMNVDELYDMYDILRSIEETLADARKLIGKGEAADVYETGYAIIGEQAEVARKRKNGKRSGAAKARDSVINLSLSPMRSIERMSGYKEDSALVDLFNDFEVGVRTKNKFVMESYKDFEAITTGKNAKEYESAIYDDYKGKKYLDVNGRKFSVSKMQMMQAILSQDREKANRMNHIENGGLNFADLGMLRKGRLKDAISNENSHRVSNATAMVESFREELREDKWAQEYMAAARNFFDGKAKDAVNETMLALKHRIVAKDSNYIPFEVDKNFIVREISAANDIQQTINSYGMLQDTKSKAPQPLIMTGLNNVIDRHIDQVATIAGLAIPVRNFNKVWNVHSVEGADTTVNNAVEENWGKEGKKLIEQVVQDIQGPRQNNQSELYKKVKSGYIGATFLLNGSVVTKQIGSLFSATSMIRWRDPVRMTGNLLYTMANFKKIAAEVDKYTASAWMRRQGMSDAEVYTLLTEGKKSKIARTLNKLPAPLNPSKWITAMDSAVALSLWKYCKADVKKAHPELKGEELNRATANLYDTVIENTQSMTDVLHRPEIQKRSDIVSETFGMFKSDLYQMAGQLQNTLGKFNANKSKKNTKALARTVYSIAASALWGQLMTTAFALLRYKVDQYRDDEDELTVESWLKRQGFALGGDLAGYAFPLFGSEVIGTIENIVYGESEDIADSLALTAINDLYSTIVTTASTIKDGEAPTWDQYKKLAIKSLQVFGIPANNILRTVEAVQLHAKDIANGEFLSFEAGKQKSKVQLLYEAILDGDDEDIKAIQESYKTKEAFDSAMRLALRNNDTRIRDAAMAHLKGNVKERVSIKERVAAEGYFDEEIVETAISGEISAFNTAIGKALEAKESGDTEEYNKIIKELFDKGYPKELIDKKLAEKAADSSNSDDNEDEIGSDYSASDIGIAYDNGYDDMALDVIKDLVKVKTENYIKDGEKKKDAEKKAKASVRSTVTSYWKPIYLQAYKSKNNSEMRRIRYILKDTDLYDNVVETCQDWIKQSKK